MKINDLMEANKSFHKAILINKWYDSNSLKAVEDIKSKKLHDKILNNIKQVITDEVQLVKRIEKECSNYLQIFDKTHKELFRGTNLSGSVFEGVSIENRRPRDSTRKNQIIYDNYLKLLGIEARRSNSIFTTSKFGFAAGYGSEVYVIIPKNTAVYSWSRLEEDIVLSDDEELNFWISEKIISMIEKEINTMVFSISAYSTNEKDVPKMRLYTEKLKDILSNNQKTIIINLEWISKNIPKSPLLKYKNTLLNPKPDLKAFQQEYQVTNKYLSAALTARHEVLIHGEYFGIHIDDWQSYRLFRRELGFIK
jgi:hypothetical protein